MITLESLSCNREPVLSLSLSIANGELPAVVGADQAEREALVELLAGYRSESGGAFVHDGQVLGAKARRNAVVVLPHRPALTPDLSVAEHLRLLARLRGAKVTDAALQEVTSFARVDKASRRPKDLDGEQQLRLTLALAAVGSPALVVALDPPQDVVPIVAELPNAHRALLLVTGQLPGIEGHVSRVHTLDQGTITEGLANAAPEPDERIFLLRVRHAGVGLESLLATHGGVTVERLGTGSYRIRVLREVAVAPLIRAIVAAGIAVEQLTPAASATAAVRMAAAAPRDAPAPSGRNR